ncbi:MAG TPA: hypothetical protein VN436_03130 [Holophaga sp.]|nr:hypothetical protein [Holophaga sp.]
MEGRITIVRSSDNKIRIYIEDELSSIRFAEVTMTLEQFALGITGLAPQDVDLEVHGLEHVGKRRVREQRSIVCPMHTYDRKELEQWLRDNAQEDGWIVSTYLGSQNSVSYEGQVRTLHYHVTKYVEPES